MNERKTYLWYFRATQTTRHRELTIIRLVLENNFKIVKNDKDFNSVFYILIYHYHFMVELSVSVIWRSNLSITTFKHKPTCYVLEHNPLFYSR